MTISLTEKRLKVLEDPENLDVDSKTFLKRFEIQKVLLEHPNPDLENLGLEESLDSCLNMISYETVLQGCSEVTSRRVPRVLNGYYHKQETVWNKQHHYNGWGKLPIIDADLKGLGFLYNSSLIYELPRVRLYLVRQRTHSWSMEILLGSDHKEFVSMLLEFKKSLMVSVHKHPYIEVQIFSLYLAKFFNFWNSQLALLEIHSFRDLFKHVNVSKEIGMQILTSTSLMFRNFDMDSTGKLEMLKEGELS